MNLFVIGISGGSGSGKSTFANNLAEALGNDNCLILRQDSYYKDLSEQFDFDGGSVNFDHPDSIDFALLGEHLDQLREGNDRGIDVPIYDFKTHKRVGVERQVQPKPYVLVDGILILSDPGLSQRFDHSIFINTEEKVRFERRLKRDVQERGRTREGVFLQYSSQVKPMHDRYVEPKKEEAHFVLNGEVPFAPQIDQIKPLLMQRG